jgi:hypothetical protein
VESDVYSRPKECLTSNIAEENMETIENMRKEETFYPSQSNTQENCRKMWVEIKKITFFPRDRTSPPKFLEYTMKDQVCYVL